MTHVEQEQSYMKQLEEREDENTHMANEIKDLVHFKAEKSELNAETFLLQTQLTSLKKKYDD